MQTIERWIEYNKVVAAQNAVAAAASVGIKVAFESTARIVDMAEGAREVLIIVATYNDTGDVTMVGRVIAKYGDSADGIDQLFLKLKPTLSDTTYSKTTMTEVVEELADPATPQFTHDANGSDQVQQLIDMTNLQCSTL